VKQSAYAITLLQLLVSAAFFLVGLSLAGKFLKFSD
jgi:hypothetical protein